VTLEHVARTAGLHRLHDPQTGVDAVVGVRAAALRALRVDDRDLVEPATTTATSPAMAGAILVPWPNRVADARWWHEGVEQHLRVTEPEFGHANHGLLASTDFSIRASEPTRVLLGAALRTPPGYPFTLDVEVEYRLEEAGIRVQIAVENQGEQTAPVALGAHPYLRVGDVAIEQLTVAIDADHVYRPGGRHLPGERVALDGDGVDVDGDLNGWDLRRLRPVSSAPQHVTFELARADRPLLHRLAAPDGSAVELWSDPAFRFTQLYRADRFPADDGEHAAIAIEPMTAPPDALNSGRGIRGLAPGERWESAWGLRYVSPLSRRR